jgi:subtilisin family serine protease
MNSKIIQAGEPETTGRYIVTFREGGHADGLAALKKGAGLTKAKMMSSADFGATGMDMSQLPSDGGAMFEHLGIALVNIDSNAAGAMALEAGEDSSILAIEPEGVMYALSELLGLSVDYLRGFRDAAQSLYASARQGQIDEFGADIESIFADTPPDLGPAGHQGGRLKFSGQGISLAILDTGLFLAHPDFTGRQIVSKSFIPGVATANDGHGHGTHCTGTSCGALKPNVGPRYGIAHKALIHIGKVLSDQGSGGDGGILAGIEWAITNKCHIISMSLGANVRTTSGI